MPSTYPEWPTGEQVYEYLRSYAEQFGLMQHISLHTEVRQLSRFNTGVGWHVELSDSSGRRVEDFDGVVVCSGQFSRAKLLDLPGSEEFEASGGTIFHSSQYRKDHEVAGQDVVVLGYSKSATDVAMEALAAKARSVTMVYREAAWKIPYFFGNFISFKNILYCRATEVMFMPWAPSVIGRLGRMLFAPLIWANWRALEALLEFQFRLTRMGPRPNSRIEDSFHCATSFETPGFYRAIERGDIRMVRGTLSGCRPGHVITDRGVALEASLVILAIGWKQELPFIDRETRSMLVEPDGQYKLYRMIVNPELPGLGFVGFNSSFITTLSAELSANWLARWFSGDLQVTATQTEMREDIARTLNWKRRCRPVTSTFNGLCIASYHHFHFDELMKDMGAQRKPRNPIVANLLPISPKRYASLLSTAIDQDRSAYAAKN
jgi:cation diffusion facilitator CzcD-associated flavoprotein CzcO